MKVLSVMASRGWLSLTTIPNAHAVWNAAAITAATTIGAGITAVGTGFIHPFQDFDPPPLPSLTSPRTFLPWVKPLSAFLFPSLLEELFWRGILLPPPPAPAVAGIPSAWMLQAGVVLMIHVATHPLAGRTIWPRGRKVFEDPRFLCLATMVLTGATASFYVSGGSVWAAAFTHGVPVLLWRDFLGGETKLMQGTRGSSKD
jgi:predicted Abi (CAAX) family protease